MVIATLTNVKEWLGITGTTYDAALDNFGTRAEARIARLCNRPDGFTSATKTEYFDGECADRLVLTYTPVTSVTSVQLLAQGSVIETIQSTGYSVDANSGTLGLDISYYGRYFGGSFLGGDDRGVADGSRRLLPNLSVGFRNVKAIYVGGYTTYPEDLKQAVIEYTAFMFRSRSFNPALTTHTLGQHSWTMGPEGLKAFESYIVDTWLASYVRKVVAL
jgi:hypothetical protein